MSENAANRTKRRPFVGLTTLLAVAALALALYALYAAHRDESGQAPTLDLSDGVTAAEATLILERANDATAFSGNLLSFLEVSMAAISLALVVGAWMLRSMILDQIEESRALSQRIEATLTDYETRFAALQATVEREVAVLSLQLLAEQQVRAHNNDTAIATLQRALTIDETDHATNYLLGYLYTQRKELDLAIEHLQRALDKEPDFTPAIAALGLALRRKGDGMSAPGQEAERQRLWEGAEARLKEALARDPRLTDAEGESYYGTLGGLYRRQNRLYAALDVLRARPSGHAAFVVPADQPGFAAQAPGQRRRSGSLLPRSGAARAVATRRRPARQLDALRPGPGVPGARSARAGFSALRAGAGSGRGTGDAGDGAQRTGFPARLAHADPVPGRPDRPHRMRRWPVSRGDRDR